MTVTYNGSTLTTDTLYEDGTIEVKDGFIVEKITSTINHFQIISIFKKDTVLKKDLMDIIDYRDCGNITYSLTDALRKKQAILIFDIKDTTVSSGNLSLLTIRKKKFYNNPLRRMIC